MAEARRVETIAAIAREEWNSCFPHCLEDYDYCLAVERAVVPGFTFCYYTLTEGDTLLAAFPAFYTKYDLATTADGTIKKILTVLRAKLNLACIGSFATETCLIAFHPDATPDQKRAWFAGLLAFFKRDARAHRTGLLAFKDVSDANKTIAHEILAAHGFTCVAGMPTAVSPVTFKTIDDYIATLSANARKDIRRKIKKNPGIEITHTRDIEPYLDDIYSMYLETKSRSDLQFEELTRDYFRNVAQSRNGICSLYILNGKLIACNVMLEGHSRLLDKFFCMRELEGQEHNLYFISWIANLQYCLDKAYTTYQSGQAGYETKLRLGSQLENNWMYFHHRNALVNALLKLAAPLMAFDVPANSQTA